MAIELVWVLGRAYGFSKGRIADVLMEPARTEELEFEEDEDFVKSASSFRRGTVDFSDLMITAAAYRNDALPLYTFDHRAAQLENVELLKATVS